MDTWIDIRRKARELHGAALVISNGDRRAEAIIQAAIAKYDLEIRRFKPGTIFNDGVLGSLDRPNRLVNVASGLEIEDEVLVVAHEIGHYLLHVDPINEVVIHSVGLSGDAVEGAAGKVEGYSPNERKELQADIFAGELLCPSDWLREQYMLHAKRPSEIALDLGLLQNLVLNQTVRALLLPPLRPHMPENAAPKVDLDCSQQRAATWDEGPLLVNAGPGTGKTRTLVHRIKHCLDSGASPSSILALTFSNKAAEEMHERLAIMNPDSAVEIWVGTFHAFGLELIRKWPSSVGRTLDVKILDEAGALALLEENLVNLQLHHYQNLYEPAYELVHILRAISRCKDELISPDEYLAAAQAEQAKAVHDKDAEAVERAEKLLEIALVYEVYERALLASNAVDFGDLIVLATKLVESNDEVKAHIANYKFVHVDEYQDVNFASARLLQAICRLGAVPWVVADQRQSIYRFRGAEPSNVTRFKDEFDGQNLSLANNYRSFSPIVRIFEGFSAEMGTKGSMKGSWHPYRADGGAVTMTVAPTLAAEAESIKHKIEEFRAKGIPYSDQMILARTHLTLERLTRILEQLNVPMLYLGDLFERKEIRDLLSLVALDSEYGNVGFSRVAALPEYQVPREDTLKIHEWMDTNKVLAIAALTRLDEIPDVSAAGRVGLARLGRQLDGLENAPPWTFLTKWLFERSDYLRPLLISGDAKSQQALIAIYQLLKVCSEQFNAGNRSRKDFLARIRRIEALSQEGGYRAVSSEASDIDAVRVLTIHGSKGLEFGAVHFPALATRYMPTNRQSAPCPAPVLLKQLAKPQADHEAEEECLFFVGLSRARDYLSLSRAEKYTKLPISQSKFLEKVSRHYVGSRFNGSGLSFAIPLLLSPQSPRVSYPEHELAIYMKCPARYKYEVADKLRGSRGNSPYILFHRCVHRVLGWLESERSEGRPIDAESAVVQLRSEWDTRGPTGHGFEAYYWRSAEKMIRHMVQVMLAEAGTYERLEWTFSLEHTRISVKPDRVLVAAGRTVRVQQIRSGRKTKSEPDKEIYALLRHGANVKYPGYKIFIEAHYLSTGEVVEIPEKDESKKLQKYLTAIKSIESGDFHAVPDARTCPNCQHYFSCEG